MPETKGNKSIPPNFLSKQTFLHWIDESAQFGDFCVLDTLLPARIGCETSSKGLFEERLFKTFWYGDAFRQRSAFFSFLSWFLRENLATRKQN
jgi:hypothetical protein